MEQTYAFLISGSYIKDHKYFWGIISLFPEPLSSSNKKHIKQRKAYKISPVFSNADH